VWGGIKLATTNHALQRYWYASPTALTMTKGDVVHPKKIITSKATDLCSFSDYFISTLDKEVCIST